MSQNEKILPLRSLLGYVTNVDQVDLKENYAIEAENVRLDRPGVIGEREPGTKHLFSSYPLNPAYTVTGASVSSGLVLTIGTHAYVVNDLVDVSGLVMTGEDGNGKRQIVTAIAATTITIGASTASGTYTSGGTVRLSMTNVDCHWLDIAGDKEYCILITVDGRAHTRIWVRPKDESSAWDELTVVRQATVNSTPAAAALEVIITGVTDLSNETIVLGANDVRYWIVWNQTRSNSAFCVSNTNDSNPVLTFETKMGSDLMDWQATDVLRLYRMQGLFDIDQGQLTTFFNQGTTPHTRWLTTPELNKVNLYLGSNADPPVMQYALRIQKGANTITPSTWDTGVYKFNTQNTWYIDLAEVTDKCVLFGSKAAPVLGTDSDIATEAGDGFKVTFYPDDGAGIVKYHRRGYVTVLYRGVTNGSFYEESDPIAQFFLSPSGNTLPDFELDVAMDLSRLSKSVCGVRCYVATKKDEDIASDLANWVDEPEEYVGVPSLGPAAEILAVSECLFDEGNHFGNLAKDTSTKYVYTFKFFQTATAFENALTAQNILANLGHTPDKNRSRIKPRFATKIDRTQGAIVAAYQDDRTIRFSGYSGAGTHMDDVFPDVSVDNNDMPQRVLLNGIGSMLHEAFAGGILCVFRYHEIEFFDLEGVRSNSLRRTQWRVRADVASARSIVTVPEGIIWLGDSGAYLIRVNEGTVTPIGNDILNLIDGSLKLKSDPTTSVWTTAARRASIGGHDPTYRTVWFQVLTSQENSAASKYVQYRWSRTRNNFSPSIRNIGSSGSGRQPITAFSETKADGTMTIVYPDGLLTYPNVSGDTRFNDDVASDGTGGNGIGSRIKIVLGSLSGLVRKFRLKRFVADVQGKSVNRMGRYNVRFYGNRGPVALDEKAVRLDDKPIARGINQQIGALESAEIEMELPTDGLDNLREVVMSGFDVVYEPEIREDGER